MRDGGLTNTIASYCLDVGSSRTNNTISAMGMVWDSHSTELVGGHGVARRRADIVFRYCQCALQYACPGMYQTTALNTNTEYLQGF
jgi:hypothetical protein